jgi:hypothetical protein
MTGRGFAYNFRTAAGGSHQIWSPRRIWRHEPGRLWARLRGIRRHDEVLVVALAYRDAHPERFNLDQDAEPYDFDNPPQGPAAL